MCCKLYFFFIYLFFKIIFLVQTNKLPTTNLYFLYPQDIIEQQKHTLTQRLTQTGEMQRSADYQVEKQRKQRDSFIFEDKN